MKHILRIVHLSIVSGVLLAVSTIALAQEKTPWSDLSPDERQVLLQMEQQIEQRWEELSGERQQLLRRGASRWLQMPPSDCQSAETIRQRFNSLSPDQQQLINQRFRQFNRLQRGRQQQLRNTQRRFRDLPESERARLREQFESQARQRAQRQRQQQNRANQNERINQERLRRQTDQQVRPVNPGVRQDRVVPRVQRTIPQTDVQVRPDVRIQRQQRR